jgi:hypothetical protein
MRVLPFHGGLNDGMELFERHRDRYLDLTPDRRIAVEQIDAQRRNPVRRDAILGAHAASLAGWCCQFHGNNSPRRLIGCPLAMRLMTLAT